MTVFLSKLISLLFHPVFMPILGLWLVLETEGFYQILFSASQKKVLYLLFLVLTVVMPLVSMMVLVRNRFVSGFHMPQREERFIPYIQSTIYFGMLYYFVRSNGLIGPFAAGILGTIVVLVLLTLINIRTKLSAHMAGVAGVTGIMAGMIRNGMIPDAILTVCALLILCGLVGTARLSLKAHRPAEIYLGGALGFLVEFTMVGYDLYL